MNINNNEINILKIEFLMNERIKKYEIDCRKLSKKYRNNIITKENQKSCIGKNLCSLFSPYSKKEIQEEITYLNNKYYSLFSIYLELNQQKSENAQQRTKRRKSI